MTYKMINVDDEKWKKFKIACMIKGTTMTEEVDIFIEKFLEMVK